MQLTLENLPGLTLDVSYDPGTEMITLTGTDPTGAQVLSASVFQGTVPTAPPPVYVQLDPPPAA